MEDRLIVSSSCHLHTRESVAKIMWLVVLSLMPAGMAGVFIFGVRALWIIILGIVSALAAEAGWELLARKEITLNDGSAFLTGLLLAYNLPSTVPYWIPVVGSFFAVIVGKMCFGGLGKNIFNPALVGRVFLMASWPKYLTSFIQPTYPFLRKEYDTLASATPLALLKEGKSLEGINYLDLFLGNRGGCIGEVCILALLIGVAFLFWRGYISWHIPLSFIFATSLIIYIFAGKTLFSGDWLFHLLSGGLILGAFFMATDYVTSPLSHNAQIIYGIGCGVLTAVIRIWGGYPEGVSYAILIMNAFVPLFDRHIRPRIYGSKLAKIKKQ